MVLMLLALLTVTFFAVNLAPGSPFSNKRRLAPEVEANLKAKYGLDQPRSTQYFRFLARLAGFTYHTESSAYSWRPVPDFGDSIRYKDRTVNSIILEAFPVSVVLGCAAYLIAMIVGLAAGILSALRQNTWLDYMISALSMLAVSTPSFVLGPVLVIVFSLTLYWLPPARMEWLVEWGVIKIPTLRTLALPALTLAAGYIAYIARLTRNGLVDTLRQDYIRTARAKGLPEARVVLVHGLRGALLPVVSFTGPALAFLVMGTAVVEQIFAIPGLGHYFVDAAISRDYFLILGTTAFGAITLMIANLLVDIAYAYVDPRTSYGGEL
jgi:oligopeptide transport system permease protein